MFRLFSFLCIFFFCSAVNAGDFQNIEQRKIKVSNGVVEFYQYKPNLKYKELYKGVIFLLTANNIDPLNLISKSDILSIASQEKYILVSLSTSKDYKWFDAHAPGSDINIKLLDFITTEKNLKTDKMSKEPVNFVIAHGKAANPFYTSLCRKNNRYRNLFILNSLPDKNYFKKCDSIYLDKFLVLAGTKDPLNNFYGDFYKLSVFELIREMSNRGSCSDIETSLNITDINKMDGTDSTLYTLDCKNLYLHYMKVNNGGFYFPKIKAAASLKEYGSPIFDYSVGEFFYKYMIKD